MIQLKKILFPTDFSRCADQALTHALHLAQACHAELFTLHVVLLPGTAHNNPEYGLADIEQAHARLEQAAAARMSSLVESCRCTDVTIRQSVPRGVSPAPLILTHAGECGADLIVMGTHGRQGLGHLLLGSVAEEVVRKARSPVLTICEREEPEPIDRVHRILVPIDFSDCSWHLLSYAKQIAASYGSSLQLIHVVESFLHPPFYLTERSRVVVVMDEMIYRAQRALQRLLEETSGPGLSADLHVVDGNAASQITELARRNHIDLIMIATHGLTGIGHLLLGSVTEKVIRTAPCPVLTIRASGERRARAPTAPDAVLFQDKQETVR